MSNKYHSRLKDTKKHEASLPLTSFGNDVRQLAAEKTLAQAGVVDVREDPIAAATGLDDQRVTPVHVDLHGQRLQQQRRVAQSARDLDAA